MPKIRALLGTLLILVAGGALLTPPTRADSDIPKTYAFVNGRWFDGRTFVPRPFYSVLGELHPNPPWQIDSTVDLRGGFVIPPFGEAHNHNAGMSGASAAAVTARYLREGIFYVKNPGSLPASRARPGEINTPSTIDVVFSGGGFTGPGGHPMGLVRRNIARGVMTEQDGDGVFYNAVETRDDVDRRWPAILATKPDFIKTLLLYSEEYEKRRADTTYFAWKGLDPRLLPYIVRKSHHANLRVACHVETAADFCAAVSAGVDEINHLPGFRPERDELAGYGDLGRYRLSDADAAGAARHKVTVVTTVSEVLEIIDADTSAADRALAHDVRGLIAHNLQTLYRHGVPIALGSDRFRSTSTAEAMALHKLRVFDDVTLLTMWCEATSATIFPGRKIGRLRDGYEASFLVLEGDPITDFRNLGRIRMRVKQGRLLPEP